MAEGYRRQIIQMIGKINSEYWLKYIAQFVGLVLNGTGENANIIIDE